MACRVLNPRGMYDRIARKPGAGDALYALPSNAVPGRVPLGGRRPPHVSRPGATTGVPGVIARQPAPSAAAPSTAAPTTAAPSQDAPVRAQFDTPGHIGAGDSLPGEPVVVRGIPFTPGELAALVDFIGDLTTLQDNTFTFDQVARMHYLLAHGVEDAWAWDEATGGLYSEEAQANEKHFAPSPGDKGQNFRDQFIAFFAQALEAMGDGDRDKAELLSYTAEHYLQDAFSAGHALPALDVAQDVDLIMNRVEDTKVAGEIAHRVYANAAPTINGYEMFEAVDWHIVDELRFKALAYGGAAYTGDGGMADSVRRYIHEHLAKTGLEVASQAHPKPFMLYGDHDLGSPGAAESVKAMQDALAETRRVLARGASDLGTATPIATALFERHWPRPTAAGQRTVEGAIEAGTGSEDKIISAVVDSMIATIADVMSNVVTMTHGLVRKRTHETLHFGEDPEIAPYDPYRATGAGPKP